MKNVCMVPMKRIIFMGVMEHNWKIFRLNQEPNFTSDSRVEIDNTQAQHILTIGKMIFYNR